MPEAVTSLERTNLIIVDDWGPEPLTAEQARDLLEIVDDRYDKGSLLITSQVPVTQWHDIEAIPAGQRDRQDDIAAPYSPDAAAPGERMTAARKCTPTLRDASS